MAEAGWGGKTSSIKQKGEILVNRKNMQSQVPTYSRTDQDIFDSFGISSEDTFIYVHSTPVLSNNKHI